MHDFSREFPYAWFGNDKSGADAPPEAVRPLVSLLATEKLLHGHGRSESTETSTTWTLTGATDTRLLRVTATANDSMWDASSEPRPDAAITAVAYRLLHIKTIQVTAVNLYRNRFDVHDPSWRPTYEVTFQDGTKVTLPPVDSRYDVGRERAEALNVHVLETTYADG